MSDKANQIVALETVDTFDTGSATVGGTAAALIDASVPCRHGVLLRADSTNTAGIWIGPVGVTAGTAAATDGFLLRPADPGVFLPISDVNLLFAIAGASSQKLYYFAY